MDFLRGHFSSVVSHFSATEKTPVAKSQLVDKSNLSDEDHAVKAFVRDNWQNIVTAFLLYMFAAATFTKLKGRELVAFSSVAAVWTVFQGFSAWSLAATAPIIFGIAKVVFNWATSGNSTPPPRQYQGPVFPAHQNERRDTDASPQRRDQASSHLSEQDMRNFEAAWSGAQHTISQPGAIKKSDSVSIVVGQKHQEEVGTTSTHTSPRSTDRHSTVVASPIRVATVIPVVTSANLQKEMEEIWGQVSSAEERDVRQTPPLHDSIDLEEDFVDQGHQEEVVTTSIHTSSQPSDRQPTVIASPISVATVIPVGTSANLHEVTEETSSQISSTEDEQDIGKTPSLHDPSDPEEGLSDSQLELDSPLRNTKVEEDEVVDATAQKQVKEKGEASDRASIKQMYKEALRIVSQFVTIASPAQEKKIDRLEKKSMATAFMFSRDAFFRRMEVTPEQRIALLLPSVLTEAQKEKIADLDLNGRYQSATHFQEKFFEFLEVTASQKWELIGLPVQQLAKL